VSVVINIVLRTVKPSNPRSSLSAMAAAMPASLHSACDEHMEWKKRLVLRSPSADDDYARHFFRFRSERVTVSSRDCFGGCHDYGDGPSASCCVVVG